MMGMISVFSCASVATAIMDSTNKTVSNSSGFLVVRAILDTKVRCWRRKDQLERFVPPSLLAFTGRGDYWKDAKM